MPTRNEPTIPPFWTCMPKFFGWPAQFGPMVYMVSLSLASILSGLGALVGGFISLVIWIVFLRYAMTVLTQTARGNFNADATDHNLEKGDRRPLKQVAYIVIAYGIVGLMVGLQLRVLALLALAYVTISLPAAIVVIAVDDSLGAALNPARVISVMTGIGPAYLLLVLFLFFLQGADSAAFALVGKAIPGFIKLPVVTFLSMYFLLVMYHMIGYVVYQYHEKLGYEVDKTFSENAPEDPLEANLSEAERSIARKIADGDIAGAIEEQIRDMQGQSTDVAKNQKLYKLYLTLGEPGKTLPQAQKLIGLLVNAKQADVAFDIFKKMQELSPGFAIQEAGQVLPLAEIAKRRGNAPLALSLLSGFDKKYPGHAATPDVYLLGAKILAELKQEEAQATRILNTLIARFPQSPAAAEAKTYLAVLERTRAAIKAPSGGLGPA